MRKTKGIVATSIDGHNTEVEEHFKDIYENIYNSTDDNEDVERVFDKVNKGMNISHVYM